MGHWKNKLHMYTKQNNIQFPNVNTVSKIECSVECDGEVKYFSIPIVLKKTVVNNAKELLYCEVYESLTKKKTKDTSAKTTFSFQRLGCTNIGYQMLEKMGWQQGDGLGTDKDGIVEPVEIVIRKKRSGLGN